MRRVRRLALIVVVVGLGLTMLTGCQPPPVPVPAPTGYVFTVVDQTHRVASFSPYVSDSFSCSGISPAQLVTVLEPDNYTVDLPSCYIHSDRIGVGIRSWGVPEEVAWVYPLNVFFFAPFWFYRFPTDVGFGGAWWNGGGGSMAATPQSGYYPSAVLELFHAEQDDWVYSRGVYVIVGRGWQDRSLLKLDPISVVTQLALLAGQGLKAKYPKLFPNPLPSVNPSPYVPLPDGVWPTATTTVTPSGHYDEPPSGWWAPVTGMPTPEPTPTTTR